ncbi:MAG: SGNH/GDSL hydrolase family protein [Acutalibacteraceae bacterium]|jgi:lysophospholipase L1-like esterase
MHIRKRLLALISTLLMLAAMFALPYGAAAEETPTASADGFYTVGWIQQEGVEQTWTNTHEFGWVTFTPASPIALDSWSYVLAIDVKLSQSFGFSSTDWMSYVRNGDLKIKDAGGSETTLSQNPIPALIPASSRQENAWMTMYVPLSGMNGTDYGVTEMAFHTYNDTGAYTEGGITGNNDTGVTMTMRNARVIDVSRNAQGIRSLDLVRFSVPDVEIATVFPDGEHHPGVVPRMAPLYNHITADMDVSKMNVELDLMYVGDVNSLLLQNSESFLYNANNDQRASGWGWIDRKISQTDQWYHIVTPVSQYGGVTINDLLTLSGFRGEAWNDDRNQTFVSKVKNVRITYSDVSALEAALEDAQKYTYDVDAASAVYEEKLAAARELFHSTTVDYADFSAALAQLTAARANLHHFRDWSSEVLTFNQHAYKASTAYGGSGNEAKELYYDWRTGDGLGEGQSVDLTDDGTTVGANRYFAMTVTLDRNDAYTGSAVESADQLAYVDYRLRTNMGGERRTDTYHLDIVNKTVSADQAVYELEGLLDDRAVYEADFSRIRDSIIYVFMKTAGDAERHLPFSCTLSNVRLINKSAQAMEAELAATANATLEDGKYFASSAAPYLALQSDAQTLMNDPTATLQQKYQLKLRVDAAKAQLEPVITECVQFGKPETVTSFYNSGVEGSHSLPVQTYSMTSNTVSGSVDFSKLQLRMDVMVVRDDGGASGTDTIVNGDLIIHGATNAGAGVELKYSLWNGHGIMQNRPTGVWNTIYLDLSSFENASSAVDLSTANRVTLSGYNDLRHVTASPGITVQVKNVAIIDSTNQALLERLREAFADVTAGGHDYTTASYAAYRAAYDQWYPVYQLVDPTQADAAINAMNAAKAGLVCVDPTVLTFSQWNRGWGSAGGWDFYADWRGADQGMINIANRNYLNFALRFDLTFAANGDTPLPSTLTVNSMRLALRKWADGDDPEGKERSFEWGKVLTTLDPNGVNSIDVPFTALPGIPADTDGSIRDIILTLNFNEIDDNQQIYTMTIANARLVDTTKEQMAAALEIAANETGSYISNAALDTYLAAQAAARAILAKADPTYAELESAQNAIDAAKANLSALDAQVVGNGSVDAVGGYLVATPDAGYTLAGYTVNGDWVNADVSLEVPLPGAVTVYFVAADEAVVTFCGKNNRPFERRVVKADDAASALDAVTAPTIFGYTFLAWDVDAEALAIAVSESVTATVTASYVQDDASDDYTVTLSGDMTAKFKGATVDATSFTAKFDDRVTVTATGADFSYWKLDGMVAGFEPTYTFYVSGDNTIEAVFGDSSQSADSVRLSIKKDYVVAETDGSGKCNWSIVAQHYLPAGQTAQEYGVIFAPGSVDLQTGFNNGTLVEGKDYIVVRSTSTTVNRQYMVALRHIKPGVTRQAVAYLVDGNGQLHLGDNLISKKIKDPNAPISTMLVLGDSIAAGYMDENPGAYGDNENRRYSTLIHNDTGITVTNRAVSGWATNELRNGLDDKIADIADVDLISISIGGNDIREGYNSQTETNIRNVLDRLVAKYPDARIVLHTTYNPYTGVMYSVADSVIGQLNTAVRDIEADYDQVTVLDLYTAFQGKQTTHICDDHTHPNIAGHRLIADLYEALIPTLR